MTTLKGNITVLRNSSGVITIKLQDEASGITFATVEMDPIRFADMVFGRAFVDVPITVRRLDVVGKQRIVEPRRIAYPGPAYSERSVMEQWLMDNAKEDGWSVDPSLRSQTSVERDGNAAMLNYSVIRFE